MTDLVIGVPKEIKDNENRVSVQPDGVYELVHAGHRVLATDRVRVLTSGRSTGRVDRGFAGYLRALAGEPQGLGAGQG